MLCPQSAIQNQGILPGYGKSQAYTAMTTGVRSVSLYKRFKNSPQHAFRDTEAAVGYGKMQHFTITFRAVAGYIQLHSPLVGKFERVTEQDSDQAIEQFLVGPD